MHDSDPLRTDTDSDGMPDGWEVDHGLNPAVKDDTGDADSDELLNFDEYDRGTDPQNPDSDSDGLWDGQEVTTYFTDPADADTDNDGLSDGWEVLYGLDPLDNGTANPANGGAGDPDNDGLTNIREFDNGTDPTDPDTDNDGLTDRWEVDNGLDPNDNGSGDPANGSLGDPDQDGLTNLQEQTRGTNPLNDDTDSDGLPDGWEVANNLNPRDDGSINPNNGGTGDPDNDGLTNVNEYQRHTNPWKSDSDGDQLDDGDEVDIYNTDPNDADTDDDGLSDGWEVLNGLDPNDSGSTVPVNGPEGDPDHDGLDNLSEQDAGTDPYDPDTDDDGLMDGWEVENDLDPLDSGISDLDNGPLGDPDDDDFTNIDEQEAGTDPQDPDSDGDGLPDGWEVGNGLDPLDDGSIDPDSGRKGDPDEDGLTNLEEYGLGTDATDPDSDGDGLEDGAEVNEHGTDPTNQDTDLDDLPDGWEVEYDLDATDDGSIDPDNGPNGDPDGDGLTNEEEFGLGTNPIEADTDEDGLADGAEIETYTTDPSDPDTDGDGLVDGWEVQYGLDPNDNGSTNPRNGAYGDPDNDGITNIVEQENGTSPTDIDSDGDGLPDRWELDNGLDPADDGTADPNNGANGDPDGDGVPNSVELAQGADPQDTDTDHDGLPDGWEIQYGLNPNSSVGANGPLGNPDNDGLTNLTEYNRGTSPIAADTDGDGLSDGAEVNTHGTNPTSADTDQDTLDDGWEVAHSLDPNIATGDHGALGDPDHDGLNNAAELARKTDPRDADTDGDGVMDGPEVEAGTDPLLAYSVATLKVTPTVITVKRAGGQTAFRVENTGEGNVPWTAAVTAGSSFLSVTSGQTGVNTGNVVVTFTANPGLSDRDGTVRITAAGAANSPVDIIVTQEACGVPDAPTGVQASDGTFAEKVRITWQPVAGADEYRVYWSTSSQANSAAPLSGWLAATSYDDFSAELPASGMQCVSKNGVYCYWVVARSACGESGLSGSDQGYRGTGKSLSVYEKVLPGEFVEPDSALYLRLRSDEDIDPASVWGEVTCSQFATDEVEWQWVSEDTANDGWVLYRPSVPWVEGDVITMTAGGTTLSGVALEPVTYRFEVIAEGAAKAGEAVWQPAYADFDASVLDLEVEANGVVELTVLDDAAPAAGGALSPVYDLGPGQVYDVPQRVWLPLPGGVAAADVQLSFYHTGEDEGGWYAAEQVAGWLVEDSYLALEVDGVRYLGFVVRHGGVVQLVSADSAEMAAAAVPGARYGDLLLLGVCGLVLLMSGRKAYARTIGKR